MSDKATSFRSRIASRLVSAFVIVLFLAPLYGAAMWVKDLFIGPADTRKVQSFSAIEQATGTPRLFQEPIVTVTFDDGWESIYTQALPLLHEFNIPTTQYIIAGTFEHPAYMSVAQVRSMQQAGHEVASHTVTHTDLTQADSKTLNRELSDSKAILSKEFGPIKDFASPLGAKNERTLAAIGTLYRSQRNTEGDPNNTTDRGVNLAGAFTKADIKGYTVRATTTMEDLRRMLDFTKASNGWLVLTYHQVDMSGETYAVAPAVLRQQLELIAGYGLRIAPLGQVLDAHEAGEKGNR